MTAVSKTISNILSSPKNSSLLIVATFALGFIVAQLAQYFRYTDYRWIYEYGTLLNYILVIISFGWSMIHPFIVWAETKFEFKKHLIWLFIGLLPALYLFGVLIFI